MRLTLIAVSIAAAVIAVGCKSPNSQGSSVKDVESVDSAGMNTSGQKMYVVHCSPGWVQLINNQPTDKVIITEEDFNSGNVTKRYCTTAVAVAGSGNTGNNGGNAGNNGGNAGNNGGGNPPPVVGQGLNAIPKGFYIRSEGALPCRMVQYSPILQLGVLKRVDIACATQPDLTGAYVCSDNANCKKGNNLLTYFDDHFEVEANGVIGSYTTNAAVLPAYVIVTTVDDPGTGQQSATFTIAGKNPTDYFDAGLTAYCAALNVTPTGQIWGMRFNGAPSDNTDFPGTPQGAKDFCLAIVKPRVIQAFAAWVNTP